MKKLSKKITSLVLAVVMAMPAVLVAPFAAQAEDAPSSAYWQILASTDFTQTEWSGSGDYHSTSKSPKTAAGGNAIGWNVRYGGAKTSDEVIVNSKGVNFDWLDDNNKHQGLLYMSSYNGQTSNTIFNGIDNFKIDLAFSFISKAKCNSGYNLSEARNDVPLIKLARDSSNKYSHRSQYNHQSNYFIQTMWGERSVDDDDFYVDGGTTETEGTTTGGKWAITTSDNNASSVLTTNTTYHYIVYVADKMLGCYLTDDSGNVLINYNPIEMGSYSFTPASISSIYLGASEFNWAGKYDVENIAYKSIEIYKGVDSSTYDSSRDKFLYAYFTGDSDAGETMHYAISQDGINFEAVSGGTQVWNPSTYGATETYPATDSAPYSDSVAISNHVRDSYAFIGQDGKDYVIATDLNTNNGSWGSIQNSRFLLWKMDFFGDIADTRPISIDTANLPGMDDITGATSSSHKTIKKAWAPQVLWDADVGKYMLYWSVGADGISTKIYYTYTSDFKTDFTTVKRLLYPDMQFAGTNIDNHIDADITYHNGLYYCYFKNEDGSGTGSKRIWCATAPNANGPYTDFELINTSYGAEGPQIYQTGENSYMLMIDGYGNHTYHMYSKNTPYYFDLNDETATNITSLSPRHGSIIRITDAEYQKLKKLRIGDEKRYTWENTVTNYTTNAGTLTDSAGCQFTRTYYTGPLATGGGVLTLDNTAIYSNDTNIKNYIASDVYTVTFYYKNNSSSDLNANNSIFAISNDDSHENTNDGTINSRRYNYVRLSENGAFYVNGAAVTPSGNCSDGTTTRASKLSTAVADKSNFHRYTVTSDGLITSLIVDGEYICGVLNDVDIPNTIWVDFGWARVVDYEDNRITAYFGQIAIKNVATDTGKQDEFFDSFDLSDEDLTPVSWTAKARLVNEIADANAIAAYNGDNSGFNNVVYASNQENVTSEYDYDDISNYFTSPKNVVLAFDGNKTPSLPVAFGLKCKTSWGSAKKAKVIYCAMSGSKFELKGYWRGYVNWGSGFTYTSSNTTQENYLSSASSSYSNVEHNNTGTPRVYFNKMFYKGSGATSDNNYVETITDTTLTFKNSRKGSGCPYSVAGPVYVINYKPIRDILTGVTKIPGSDLTAAQLISLSDTWKYTTDSYLYALYALKKVAAINPKDTSRYTYGTDIAAAVSLCGADIKAALEAFNNINLVKNQFNITYRMADGTTKAEIVTAGNKLANVPETTDDFHIDDSFTHMKNCAWSSYSAEAVPSGSSAYVLDATPVNGEMPMANTIYTETGTVEDCNTSVDHYIEEAGDLNGYTDKECSVCGYANEKDRVWDDDQNWEPYNTKYSEYGEIIGAEDYSANYTTSSKLDYETEVYKNTLDTDDKSYSDAYIASKATAINNAKTRLKEVADMSSFDTAFETADSLLKNLAGKAAQYDAASVQALIDELEGASVTNLLDEDVRADLSRADDQDDVEDVADDICEAINGLRIATIEDKETHESVDTSSYDSLVNTVNNLDPDAYEDVYDEDLEVYVLASAMSSVNTAYAKTTTEYDGQTINVISGIETQADADAAASRLLTALNTCVKTYDVNAVGECSASNVGTGSYDAVNDKATYGTPMLFESDDKDTAWFLEIQTNSMHKKPAFQGYGASLKAKVLGNTTVTAKTRGASQIKVEITRQYSNDLSKAPIQLVDFIDVEDNNFTLPVAVALPFYTFSGYIVNGDTENPLFSGTLSLTEDTKIIATYTASAASCAINAKDINGDAIALERETVNYNEKVDLDGGAGTYGWVEKIGDTYRPFFVGQKVSFLATESIELEAVNEEDFNRYYAAPCINLRQGGAVVSDSKTTFNAQVVAPDMDKIQEYGILIAYGNGKQPGGTAYEAVTPTQSQIIVENSGQQYGYAILRAKSTKFVGANQFSIAVNSLPSGYRYRGYVIYKDSKGNLQTAYSDMMM